MAEDVVYRALFHMLICDHGRDDRPENPRSGEERMEEQ